MFSKRGDKVSTVGTTVSVDGWKHTQCLLLGNSWNPSLMSHQRTQAQTSRDNHVFHIHVTTYLFGTLNQAQNVMYSRRRPSRLSLCPPPLLQGPHACSPAGFFSSSLLHISNTLLTFETRGFSTTELSSPNDAWNKIVTRVPMKANKTSHYRDEKVYHYHGNWEAHSQRAGWVTNKERVKEKGRTTGTQEGGHL